MGFGSQAWGPRSKCLVRSLHRPASPMSTGDGLRSSFHAVLTGRPHGRSPQAALGPLLPCPSPSFTALRVGGSQDTGSPCPRLAPRATDFSGCPRPRERAGPLAGHNHPCSWPRAAQKQCLECEACGWWPETSHLACRVSSQSVLTQPEHHTQEAHGLDTGWVPSCPAQA